MRCLRATTWEDFGRVRLPLWEVIRRWRDGISARGGRLSKFNERTVLSRIDLFVNPIPVFGLLLDGVDHRSFGSQRK